METIAQQLNIKEFPFEIKDKNGNLIYYENNYSYWFKIEFDLNEKEIRYESSNGYWFIREYDSNGEEIYWRDSNGGVVDNRVKCLTLSEILLELGINGNK